jgi:hypothetical protein
LTRCPAGVTFPAHQTRLEEFARMRRGTRFALAFRPRFLAVRLRHGLTWTTAACVVLAMSGCSSSAAGTAGAEPAKASVVKFLDAMKRGDEAAARGMLTTVARAKTEEMGISVAPPVPDTATYTIRDCEIVSDTNDLAHVATTWSDVDETGAPTSENIVWAVRLDPEGWRVVGMAMKIFEDMPPLLLNFEDPQDMIAKQEMVASELTRRAAAAANPAPNARTARGPGTPAAK